MTLVPGTRSGTVCALEFRVLDLHRSVLLERFTCLRDRCPATCCSGWRIPVDAASAERLGSLASHGERGWSMRESLHGDCVALVDGLCSLRQIMDQAAPPLGCQIYPRVVSRVGTTHWVTATLSCAAIARDALFGDETVVHLWRLDRQGDAASDRRAAAVLTCVAAPDASLSDIVRDLAAMTSGESGALAEVTPAAARWSFAKAMSALCDRGLAHLPGALGHALVGQPSGDVMVIAVRESVRELWAGPTGAVVDSLARRFLAADIAHGMFLAARPERALLDLARSVFATTLFALELLGAPQAREPAAVLASARRLSVRLRHGSEATVDEALARAGLVDVATLTTLTRDLFPQLRSRAPHD